MGLAQRALTGGAASEALCRVPAPRGSSRKKGLFHQRLLEGVTSFLPSGARWRKGKALACILHGCQAWHPEISGHFVHGLMPFGPNASPFCGLFGNSLLTQDNCRALQRPGTDAYSGNLSGLSPARMAGVPHTGYLWDSGAQRLWRA
ncbi:unnamed protein product [Caretta caretta]